MDALLAVCDCVLKPPYKNTCADLKKRRESSHVMNPWSGNIDVHSQQATPHQAHEGTPTTSKPHSPTTHQDILEFDVPMQQCLAMKEPDAFYHVHSYLHSGSKVQPDFEGSVEVPGVPRHDEENHSLGAVRVIIIYQSSNQVHHTIVFREGPEGGGGGGGEGKVGGEEVGGGKGRKGEEEREREGRKKARDSKHGKKCPQKNPWT